MAATFNESNFPGNFVTLHQHPLYENTATLVEAKNIRSLDGATI